MNILLLSVVLCCFSLTTSNVSAMCQCDNVNPAYVKLGEQILQLAAAKAYKLALKEIKEQYPEEFKSLAQACRAGSDFAQTDLGELLGDTVTLILMQVGLIGQDGKPTDALKAAMQLYVDLSENAPNDEFVIRDAREAIKHDNGIVVLDAKAGHAACLEKINKARLVRKNSTGK